MAGAKLRIEIRLKKKDCFAATIQTSSGWLHVYYTRQESCFRGPATMPEVNLRKLFRAGIVSKPARILNAKPGN